MSAFSCNLPGEIVVGEGKLGELSDYLKPLGTHCFITADPYFVASGFCDEVTGALQQDGISTTLFSHVSPNPRCRDIDEAAGICRKEGCTVVLAIGGGSAIDTGKAVAVVAKNGGSSWDYVYKSEREAKLINEVIPVVTVPTTAGTGTEATPYAVLSNPDLHEKGTIISSKIFPAFSIIDPTVMQTMPPALTALTGVDALSHCLEAFLANVRSPFSSMVSREGMKTIARNLPEAVSNGSNLPAREAMAWGSVLGGISIGHAGVGLPHALGQPVGGIINAPHGASIAACLAEVIEFSYMSSFQLFAELAECFDPSVSSLPLYTRAEKSVDLIRRFLGYIDCDVKYSDYGMQESDIEKAAKVAFDGYGNNIENYPKIATYDEVISLYQKCL